LFNEIKPSAEQPITLAQAFTGYRHFIHSIKPAEDCQEIYNVEAIKIMQLDKRVLGSPNGNLRYFSVGAIDLTGMIMAFDPENK
jgi:lipoprotein-releasing system permease protein